MQHAQLKVSGGKQDGRLIPLSAGKFLVGREEDCHLRPGSELVSRHHCVFTVDEFMVRLRDLGSTNGTLVNGDPIRGEVKIEAGDRVSIGKLEFEVLIEERPDEAQPAETAPQPEPVGETIAISSSETNAEIPVPGYPDAPAFNSGDTTILNQPMMPQPGTPQPGQYPQQVPGMYPQQPGYPMVPQQPGQYPQQGQFPQQMPYPQPGQYPQQVPMQPMPYPQAPGAEQGVPPGSIPSLPAFRLPDPSTTGLAPQSPPQDSTDEKQPTGESTEEVDPSNTAADIIRDYMKRPGSDENT